jgi:hypothetical protein
MGGLTGNSTSLAGKTWRPLHDSSKVVVLHYYVGFFLLPLLLILITFCPIFAVIGRFLPPRFDYGRPIPESMLHSPTSRQSISAGDIESGSSVVSSRGTGSRNRISGSSRHRNVTTIDESPSISGPSLDCVICCSSVDVHNRRAYMLPPCDHIFHRQCLEQWMEVKLECPICRKALPPI